MIAKNEILGKTEEKDLTDVQRKWFAILYVRLNRLRERYGKPMLITSGFRTTIDHTRVYQELAQKRKVEFDASKIPWGSAHLKCAAVDIADDKARTLFQWCQDNEAFLEEVGLWVEEKDDQARVHFQVYPPVSGHRFFKP